MASEEDRLDQLLKAAQQQMAGIGQGTAAESKPVTPQVENTVKKERIGHAEKEDADPTSFDVPKAVQDEIFSESADDKLFTDSDYQPSTENFPMKIFDEIPEEIYRKTIMAEEEDTDAAVSDAPIVNASPFSAEPAHTVTEEPLPEEPAAPVVSDDPNKMMNPDDIAALIASMNGGDETSAEEPVAEEAVVEETVTEEPAASVVDDDPNKMMSPDDIAALVASMNGGEEAPAEGPVAEEAVVEETDTEEPEAPVVDNDPNKMMSPDDIAALVASMNGGDETLAEEPVVEEPAAPVVDDDPNKMMSPDDIAALVASMNGGEDVPAEEPVVEESIEEEELPESDNDPNKIMNPDDIAALVASMSGGGEESSEENAGEDMPVADDSMSQEEINVLMGLDGNLPESEADVGSTDMDDPLDDLPLLGGGFDLEGVLGGSEDDAEHMGIDEIEEKLRAAAADAEQPDPLDDDTDVVSILQEMGESDPDLSDLGDFLQKSDNNELLDNSILEQMENAGMDAMEEEESEDEEGAGKKKKKAKKEKKEGGLFGGLFGKKKAPKETAEETDDGGKKKPGFFARLLQALTAEEEEDEAVPEGKQTKLSEENEAILKEIDAEEDGKGKKKKKKEKKAKKEKPPKPPKEKKPKKPKKEKKPAEPDNSKKIPKKYIIRTFMLSFSVLAVIMVIMMFVPALLTLSQARKAYYNEDYKTAFLTMYGKELNESDRLIYERSRLLVTLDRKYESYENYRAMGMRAEALDALLQGVKRYDDLKDKANELNVAPELDEIYIKIVAALNGDFDMSEEEARETLTYSITDYTGKVEAAAKGEPYRLMQDEVNEAILQPVLDELSVNPSAFLPQPEEEEPTIEIPAPTPTGTENLPDLLPEEQQYLEQSATPQEIQEPITTLEIPVTQNNPAVGNASSNGANVSLEIDSNQF